MKRTLIDRIPISLSGDVEKFAHGARIYDSSCSPEARVYYLERDCGYYLKIADAGTLGTEAEMTRFFHSKGLGTEVMLYESTDKDYFITKRVVCQLSFDISIKFIKFKSKGLSHLAQNKSQF